MTSGGDLYHAGTSKLISVAMLFFESKKAPDFGKKGP